MSVILPFIHEYTTLIADICLHFKSQKGTRDIPNGSLDKFKKSQHICNRSKSFNDHVSRGAVQTNANSHLDCKLHMFWIAQIACRMLVRMIKKPLNFKPILSTLLFGLHLTETILFMLVQY